MTEAELIEAINVSFLIVLGTIIFFMQCGFALLEAGSVRAKNTTNILMKNTLDASLGAIGYWMTGYAFGFGSDDNGFIGTDKFFLINTEAPEYAVYFVAYCFAVTASTIVSGAMAERTKMYGYIFFTLMMSMWIYPVASHWVYTENGWLNQLDFHDFAGSAVVHCIGGTAALVGAFIVGPRHGRFSKGGKVNPIPGHSVVFAALGFFILWFGFFAFNCVSTGGIAGPDYDTGTVGRAAVNTSLAGAGAILMTEIIHKIGFKKQDMIWYGKEFKMYTCFGGFWSINGAINGGLTGMVAICAGADWVEPWAAFVIGLVSGCVYILACKLMLFVRIDDPLTAAPIHLCGGIWGIISVALFANPDRLDRDSGGILYSWDGDSFLWLGIQLLGVAVIIAWTAFWMGLLFGSLRIAGFLRVDLEQEKGGLDYINSEPAYPMDFGLFEAGDTGGSGTNSSVEDSYET